MQVVVNKHFVSVTIPQQIFETLPSTVSALFHRLYTSKVTTPTGLKFHFDNEDWNIIQGVTVAFQATFQGCICVN